MELRKYDIVTLKYGVDLSFLGKHMQKTMNRPFVILSNDINNKYSPNVNIAPLTTQLNKILPCHAKLKGIKRESFVLCEQIVPIDKNLIHKVLEHIKENEDCNEIKRAITVQLIA